MLVAERIAGKDVRPINYGHVPACTYCDPEIGSVGLTEKAAREQGYDVTVGQFAFPSSAAPHGQRDRRLRQDRRRGRKSTRCSAMIGPRSTELVAEATLALRLECTVEELMRTIHAHPTMSEAVLEAAHAAHGAAIHA